MRKHDNSPELLFSPSDLTRFVDSPFASWMARYQLEVPDFGLTKDPPDPLLDYLAGKGLEHESAFLSELRTRFADVVSIDSRLSDAEKLEATRAAMLEGAQVIFQACLEKLPFRGYADFLIRVEAPSNLGDYAYVAWDTKLAKEMKPYFILQLCCYSDMLEAMQGFLPDTATVVLGTGEQVSFNVSDYFSYYLATKDEFLEQQRAFDSQAMSDPFQYPQHGEWSAYVESLRQARDHLSKVANITRNQIAKLERAGITSMRALADAENDRIPQLHQEIYRALQEQAKLQARSEDSGQTEWVLREPAADRVNGLVHLPPENPADLYWDLEGFPLEEGGLEYLWGCTYFDEEGTRCFWERWAHDHDAEQQAFTDFIQWAYQRWRENPSMHIYHFGHYEVSVCKRLMGRYGACEFEVDQLLRHGVFVDLYRIVLQGLVVGEPAYSIKNIEHLYRGKRETAVASGGESVVVYAKWREAPVGPDWPNSDILRNIRDYNVDDCNSTQELTAWLRQVQADAGLVWQQPAGSDDAPQEREPDDLEKLEGRLLALTEDDRETEEVRFLARQLAHLVLFHRRENKPTWWRYFERCAMSFEELYDDPDSLAGCIRTDREPFKYSPRVRNLTYEYRFDPSQEFRNRRFEQVHVLGLEDRAAKVAEVDGEKGLLLLSRKHAPPDQIDVIVHDYVHPGAIEESISAIGERYLESRQLDKPLREFLLRAHPDVDPGLLRQVEVATGDERLPATIQAVFGLNNTVLTVQGPPGSGKTYTASHVILALLQAGKRVGITSNSHKAINHLMVSTFRLCEAKGQSFPFTKVQQGDDELFEQYPFEQIKSGGDIWGGLYPGSCVIGATAWGFSTSGGQVDYLFIDEAGQVSLAKLAAMCPQAANIICLGDQMQLPQPIQGTHPGDSACSILDYFLMERATVPPELGIFLNQTFRMHQEVNHFISQAIYNGRLGNDPLCDNQKILLDAAAANLIPVGTGIHYLEIAHTGNKQASSEECEYIAQLVNALGNCHWVDKHGVEQSLTREDILVVAPFNYQVNELRKSVGDSARIGTVDLFQGQEAPIVIISMAASVAADSARGVDFLLNQNRLNVAVSRAKALAIIVASKTLLEGTPGRLQDMRLYNLFYRLKQEYTHAKYSGTTKECETVEEAR